MTVLLYISLVFQDHAVVWDSLVDVVSQLPHRAVTEQTAPVTVTSYVITMEIAVKILKK